MATSETTSPEAFLLALFPPALIRKTAHLVGAVQRQRLVDILSLILVVVLTPSGQGEQPIAGMRRELERRTGLLLARSSFWDRLSPNFGRLVRRMLDSVVERAWSTPPPLLGFLADFKDVIAGDATVVQVHKSLASRWKGTGSPAAVKVHTLIRALTGELLHYKITAETRPECRVFGVGHWAKDVLFLLDRGYSAAALWWRIHRVGGFFVTRLKKSFHAVIVEVNPRHRGSRQKAIGTKVWDLLKGRQGHRIDVMCRFSVRVRAYGKAKGRRFDHLFRVVAVWNKVEKRYQIYVTNVPPHRFSAEQVAASYRLRWTVERFYVAAKSGMGLDRITSSKPHIVETLIRAALLRCTVAMQAKREAERHLPPQRWMNPLMWIKVWRARLGDMLLGRWLNGGRSRDRTTWARLALLAIDPARTRLSPRVLAGWGFSFPWAWQRHSAR
jgi:hypothetical protein